MKIQKKFQKKVVTYIRLFDEFYKAEDKHQDYYQEYFLNYLMKREKINSDQTNFIGCWKILNDELFLNLINFFEYNKHLQNQGVMGSGKNLIKKKQLT